MRHKVTTFQEVFNRWTWKPIRNCPGRYTLAEGVSRSSLSEIAAYDFPIFEFASEIVPDRVFVIKFSDGGGIISYRKSENCFLHTLNNEVGFTRKIAQLRIKI